MPRNPPHGDGDRSHFGARKHSKEVCFLVAVFSSSQGTARMAREFYDAVAKDSRMSPVQVKKVLGSMFNLTVKTLQNGENIKIPNYCTVKLHKKPARPEQVKNVFGKEVKVAAREASSTVRIAPVKKLRDQVAKA